MTRSDHPAVAVLNELATRPPTADELAALIEIARGVARMVPHQDADGADQAGLREYYNGWRQAQCGAAHLAGRQHISEA